MSESLERHVSLGDAVANASNGRRFVLEFADERDFVLAASGVLGAAYVSGPDAAKAIAAMPSTRSFGAINISMVDPRTSHRAQNWIEAGLEEMHGREARIIAMRARLEAEKVGGGR